MAKKVRTKSLFPSTPKEHIRQLIEWMSQGVYEKEQIIAVALLCAMAGENMFLLGPAGTAKSMVASRLKMVFKDGKSFDYLMSRFSTPDEIFGPISISRLKNDDRYDPRTRQLLSRQRLCRDMDKRPHHFSFAMRDYDELVGWEKSKEDTAQLETIMVLWSKSHTVVNSMSPCFEGELNFINLYWHICRPVKVLRAWLPRLRKAAILKAVRNGAQDPAKYEQWLGQQLINHFIEVDAGYQETDTAPTEIPENVKPGDTVSVGNVNFSIVSCEERPLYRA